MAYRRSRGMGALATPPANIQTVLQNASAQYGVPLSLLQAVAQQESSYNPTVTSSAGAQGLMQIMPANDASLGLTNPFDPQQSANAGAQMLAALYRQYGDWNTALIAYNEGSGNLATQGVFPSSASYASAILLNAGMDSGQMGPPPLDSTDATALPDLSSLFDLSSGGSTSGVDPITLLVGALLLGGLLWVLQ